MTTTRKRSWVGRFFRNPQSDEIVVAQPPNAPLLVWLAATVIRLVFSPSGVLGTALSVVATVSLVIWSLLEMARGDSPFRRVLGGVVLAGILIGFVLR
ncbi:MAG: hypothetical protein QOE05_2359 [Actinomycetota bacterium]|jgi:hypothetical protein|nr:hypothetical protein [Actinomycetota bacterium]